MAIQNISKYVQINDFLLLEYEFSRDGTELTDAAVGGSTVVITDSSVKQFFNNTKSAALGTTNNILELNSTPTSSNRNNWFNDYTNAPVIDSYNTYFDSSVVISNAAYEYDTVKVHIVSGYNFDDVAGFLLQVRAKGTDDNLVDLSNFTYVKQPDSKGSNVIKFATNSLYLGNRFYDKYVTFKIPSVYALGSDTDKTTAETMGHELNIAALSDVYLTYGTIATLQSTSGLNTFVLSDYTDFRLPVTSSADNFNAFIAESTVGDFIEFYATWKDIIIGEYMGDIESGRIPLYTSNNPNDNYAEFTETYGAGIAKWVLIHEVYVYENLPGATTGSSLLTQKYVFTQEDNFNLPNYFRPVLKNADIDASYTIQYICRLSNRMDGTQIIRRASFASSNPKKYGLKFTRLTMENLIPYKVFNKISSEKANVIQGASNIRTKYSKVFYDTSNILFNQDDLIYPNGIGPLFLKNGDSVYKLKFERYNEITSERENVDLSGAYNYALIFKLDNNSEIEVVPTYSENMNTTIGELEFKLTSNNIAKLLSQTNKKYSVVVKNPDGTYYSFYEGDYFSNSDAEAVLAKYNNLNVVSRLENENAALTEQLEKQINDYNQLLSSQNENTEKYTALSEKFTTLLGESRLKTKRISTDQKEISSLLSLNSELTKKNDLLIAENTILTKENKILFAENDNLKSTSSTGRNTTPPSRNSDVIKPEKPEYDEDSTGYPGLDK